MIRPIGSDGAVLLTVVFVLIIIGLVGSAIYSLTYTSTYTQMSAQNASRAYFIAESGARIVAAEYNRATEVDINPTPILENLHNETLTLPDNNGQIGIRIYPYWFYVVNGPYAAPVTSLDVKMPGGIPVSDPENPGSSKLTIPGNGNLLKIQGKTQRATIDSYSPITPNDGDVITFNLSTGFPFAIENDEEVFLVFIDPSTNNQTIDNLPNGTLDLPATNEVAQFLPVQNGSFRIFNENNDKTDYTYREKIAVAGSPSKFRLAGITHQDPANLSLLSIDITPDSEIYLGKNIAAVATTALGQGLFAGQKTVVTYTDVGLDGGFNIGRESISFEDDIEDFNYPGLPMNNPGGGDPIVVDEGAKEINLGGGLKDGYGSVWYGGQSDRANCIDGRCNLGKGFRAYFEFVSNLQDTSPDSTRYGDGFTFSIISGVYEVGPGYRNSKYDTGGPMGEYLGYAGPGLSGDGLKSPKIALELDTFPNTGAGSLCPPNTNSRNDDTPVANHIALDYWGVGSATNAPGSLDAIGGGAGGGYMRIGSATPSNGDPEDWSSPKGTISFWFKRDTIEATNNTNFGDRLWGQSSNMEMRLTGNGSTTSNLVLDWGTDNALTAVNPFTLANKWYFMAIVWDETTNTLSIYTGDESSTPVLLKQSSPDPVSPDYWDASLYPVSSVGIIENLFMNSSGGDGANNFAVDGQGSDLRYYDIARDALQIQSDYNLRLSSMDANLQVYYPLESDFANAAALLPVAESVPSTDWSIETPVAFDCSSDIVTRDDNRHGAGGGTTQPMNSLNTSPGLGDDGYYQVVKDPNPLVANWLEDGDCYGVRLELVRPKDPDGGVYKYQIKAWVNSVDATCTGLSANYKDTGSTYGDTDPQIELTIDNSNPLELAESVHLDLKDILFGFTQGTGGATQDITLKYLDMRFIKAYPPGFPNTW